MGTKNFSQKQKLTILDSAAEIGVEQAAQLAGVHYTNAYDWRRQLQSLGRQGFLDYKPSYPGRGFIFYSWRGINRFERFLQTQGIDHTHARAHHPQTLGKVEACNRRLKQKLIDQQHFTNVHDARAAIDRCGI